MPARAGARPCRRMHGRNAIDGRNRWVGLSVISSWSPRAGGSPVSCWANSLRFSSLAPAERVVIRRACLQDGLTPRQSNRLQKGNVLPTMRLVLARLRSNDGYLVMNDGGVQPHLHAVRDAKVISWMIRCQKNLIRHQHQWEQVGIFVSGSVDDNNIYGSSVYDTSPTETRLRGVAPGYPWHDARILIPDLADHGAHRTRHRRRRRPRAWGHLAVVPALHAALGRLHELAARYADLQRHGRIEPDARSLRTSVTAISARCLYSSTSSETQSMPGEPRGMGAAACEGERGARATCRPRPGSRVSLPVLR
jgi:hypothetical protein